MHVQAFVPKRISRNRHLVGADDRVVPPELAEAFVARFTDRSQIHLRRLSGFDHHCCWAEAWPRLWPQLQSR